MFLGVNRLVGCCAVLCCLGTDPLLRGADRESPNPAPQTLSKIDKDLLNDISRRSFRYFLEQTDPRTGLVFDRAFTNGGPAEPQASGEHRRHRLRLDGPLHRRRSPLDWPRDGPRASARGLALFRLQG